MTFVLSDILLRREYGGIEIGSHVEDVFLRLGPSWDEGRGLGKTRILQFFKGAAEVSVKGDRVCLISVHVWKLDESSMAALPFRNDELSVTTWLNEHGIAWSREIYADVWRLDNGVSLSFSDGELESIQVL